MRIAVWHNLPSGGGKRALYNHVRGLVERGHHVAAWCPPTADRGYLPLGDLVSETVVDLAWPVPFRRSDDWQLTLEMEHRLAVMDAHCRECARQINEGGFDVLFANTCTFFATSSIGRHVDMPSALYLQEPSRHLYEAIPRLRWAAPPRGHHSWAKLKDWRRAFADWRQVRNWRVQVREERLNAGGFSKLLVNSYFSRESVLRAYGLNSEVCYLGVDTHMFVPRDGPRQGYVVGLGAVIPTKGVALAIEAIATMPPPRPALIWVGNSADAAHKSDMVRLAGRLRVEVDFRIGISDDDLVGTLNGAFAMVYAPRLEPFGLAPLEANACGVGVVAVAEGGVRETIVDGVNGMLVDHDPAAMAAAIESLRDDPAKARRLGEAGRTMVSDRWSTDAATGRIERALAAMVRS